MPNIMRAHLVIAAVAVVFVGVGATLVPFADPKADSLFIKNLGLDVSRLHQDVKNLPVQKSDDMSFVFSGGDSAGGIAPATPDEPRKGWFTPRCAERDRRAYGVIEELGQIDEMPSAWLADAGLNWLQARSYCLSGAEHEGVVLYDMIIAGDARMPKALTMNERVTP
jgi:hypothetical protein